MSNKNTAFYAYRKRFQIEIQERYNIDADTYIAVTELLTPIATLLAMRKGEFLQRAGEPAKYLYWMVAGVTRSGFNTETGTEMTMAFAVEGHSATPYHDLLGASAGQPARYFIVAETPIEVFRLEWETLTTLLVTNSGLRRYHLQVVEYMLMHQARRGYTHLAASAADRLASFRRDYPGLEARISQKVVASYLEITPQYLSQLLHAGAAKP